MMWGNDRALGRAVCGVVLLLAGLSAPARALTQGVEDRMAWYDASFGTAWNPMSRGWRLEDSDRRARGAYAHAQEAVDGEGACWEVRDESPNARAFYRFALDPEAYRSLGRRGWKFSLRARVSGLGDETPSAFFEYADGTRLWHVMLEETPVGELVAVLLGDGGRQRLVLQDENDNEFHEFELWSEGGRGEAHLAVDGEMVGEAFAPIDADGVEGLRFGTKSLPGTGVLGVQTLELLRLPARNLDAAWIFGDHMVLPSGSAVPVWGTAAPGTRVTLTFDEQWKTALTGIDGRWRAYLDACEPTAQGRELALRTEDEALVFEDVVVGDVWLCAGQSNMDWRLADADEGPAAARSANLPLLRLLNRTGSPRVEAPALSPAQLSKITAGDYYDGFWRLASPASAAPFSAIGFYFGRALLQKVDHPIGIVDVSVGSASTEGWIPRSVFDSSPELAEFARNWRESPLTDEYLRERAQAQLSGWVALDRPWPKPQHFLEPGFLYSSAIETLAPFPLRGVLWYQGESNAHAPELHAERMRSMIESWRTAFANAELPFYFVQLPGFLDPKWALFREAQASVQEIPHTAMAVTIDVGNPKSLHPRNKRPVGERLARLALSRTYGVDIVDSGPVFRDWSPGNPAELRFDNAQGGLIDRNGGVLEGFLIAGDDRHFAVADARLGSGDRVLVSSPEVPEPVAVRYAFGADPPCDLANVDELPAAPFRTDDWPDATVPRAADSEVERKLNVLFIAVDDLRPALGCYGDPVALTPNIDRLAQEGMLFDRAYTQMAVCCPSRTSTLTGLRPDTTHVWRNSHFRNSRPGTVTLPQHFKRHGFVSKGIGKIFHDAFSPSLHPYSIPDPDSWSEPFFWPGPRYYYTERGVELARAAYVDRYRVTDPDPDDWTRIWVPALAVEAPEVADNVLYDGQVADVAIEDLRRFAETGEPFFLAAGFLRPHLPFVAPKRYWDLYEREELPDFTSAAPEGVPSVALHDSPELRYYHGMPREGPLPDATARELVHGYYACVSYVDAQVGRMLDELDRLGLREDTVVVLWGDHGWHLGEHGLWGKTTNFELDTRVPLIVSAPGRRGGRRSTRLVEMVDLYPTLVELSDLPPRIDLEGTSFASLLEDPARPWKDAVFSQFPRGDRVQFGGDVMGYSMRTERYRYTEWVRRLDLRVLERELYDHETDPAEQVNIVAQADKELLAGLARQLSEGWRFARPPKLGDDRLASWDDSERELVARYDARHAEDRDPSAQGWSLLLPEEPDAGLTVRPAAGAEGIGWVVTDESQRGSLQYDFPLDSGVDATLLRRGFELSVRARVLDGGGAGPAACFQYGDGARRWLVFLDEDQSGALVAQLYGEGAHQLITLLSANDRRDHDFTLRKEAGGAAGFLFDGQPHGAAIEPIRASSVDGVRFGVGSSGGRGTIAVRRVALAPLPERSLRPGWIFGSHMVLPRDRAVPVWGLARPGAQVHVFFAGESADTRAKDDGTFRVYLPALEASTAERTLTIRSGEETLIYDDVLVGDVWLLAGQSNMNLMLAGALEGPAAAESSDLPRLRLLNRSAFPSPAPVPFSPAALAKISAQDYFEGDWQRTSTHSARPFSAVGFFFGRALHDEVRVPVGLVDVSVGGSSTEGWVPKQRLVAEPGLADLANDFLGTLETHPFMRERTLVNLDNWVRAGSPQPRPRHSFEPGFLFDAAIEPLAGYPLTGVLWYQGESNAHIPELHARLFRLVIESWRAHFANRELPFYFVQLPSLARASWPEFRESQAQALGLGHVDMAVTIDLGHPTNVHPIEKRPVGERLARLVLAGTYGTGIPAHGPTVAGFEIRGSDLVITFDNAHGGLVDRDGRALEGFFLAGANRRFHPARAEIAGRTVVLNARAVPEPVAARYAWESVPACDLSNGEGLPAAPFRTDDWAPVRIACIGDSLTSGHRLADPERDAWPAVLDMALGPGFEVRNFGRSGACVTKGVFKGEWERAFAQNPEHRAALDYRPHVVISSLGINDLLAWPEKSGAFEGDYLALLDEYRALDTKPQLFLWGPLSPLFPGHDYHASPHIGEIEAAIESVARRAGARTIDMREPLERHADWFKDHIHPDAEGASITAEAIRRALESAGVGAR